LDAQYYITRVLIPPLERIFNLIGADVRQWYNEMPRPKFLEAVSPSKGNPTGIVANDRLNIYEHFDMADCLICGVFTRQGVYNYVCSTQPDTFEPGLCDDCRDDTQVSQAGLLARIRDGELRLVNTHRICGACSELPQAEPVSCVSLDCPWLFARKKANNKTELLDDLVQQLTTEVISDNSLQSTDTDSPKEW
jgi:DNA polymerase zeta